MEKHLQTQSKFGDTHRVKHFIYKTKTYHSIFVTRELSIKRKSSMTKLNLNFHSIEGRQKEKLAIINSQAKFAIGILSYFFNKLMHENIQNIIKTYYISHQLSFSDLYLSDFHYV